MIGDFKSSLFENTPPPLQKPTLHRNQAADLPYESEIHGNPGSKYKS